MSTKTQSRTASRTGKLALETRTLRRLSVLDHSDLAQVAGGTYSRGRTTTSQIQRDGI